LRRLHEQKQVIQYTQTHTDLGEKSNNLTPGWSNLHTLFSNGVGPPHNATPGWCTVARYVPVDGFVNCEILSYWFALYVVLLSLWLMFWWAFLHNSNTMHHISSSLSRVTVIIQLYDAIRYGICTSSQHQHTSSYTRNGNTMQQTTSSNRELFNKAILNKQQQQQQTHLLETKHKTSQATKTSSTPTQYPFVQDHWNWFDNHMYSNASLWYHHI